MQEQLSSYQCSTMYFYDQATGNCQHYFMPPNTSTLIGFVMTFVSAGVSSLAGLGSGTVHLVIVLILYNYLPKQSTIVIFCCIMGTTLGNVLSKINKKINGQSVIQHTYAFVSIPIMFMASVVGVLLNKLLPTMAVCLFIMYMTSTSLNSIYQKFRVAYVKETKQNQKMQVMQKELLERKSIDIDDHQHEPRLNQKDQSQLNQSIKKQAQTKNFYTQTLFNPLQNEKYRHVFKNLLVLYLIYILLSMAKGTQKFDSLIDVSKCSLAYWALYLLLFITMGWFSCYNLRTLNAWASLSEQKDNDAIMQDSMQQSLNVKAIVNEKKQISGAMKTNTASSSMNENIKLVIKMSFFAGIFAGFGLGGGMFLVPMYKTLGLNSIQAASTCAFSLLINSVMNCLQGIFFGIIGLEDFIFLFGFSVAGSYFFSLFVTKELQKRNRTSLVQGILALMIVIALINIPLAMFLKYQRNGYNADVLLSFGDIC